MKIMKKFVTIFMALAIAVSLPTPIAKAAESENGTQLYADTFTVTPKANLEMVLDEETETYCINNIDLGEKVELSVEPTSDLENPVYTYKWFTFKPFDKEDWFKTNKNEVVSNKDSYTFTKTAGRDNVYCEISDGLTTQYVNFVVNPKTTITFKPTINNPRLFTAMP